MNPQQASEIEREELVLKLLASLPRSRLAGIQRRIAPLLQFDLVGSLPDELALLILSHLAAPTLLECSLVCHRWQRLANEPSLWKSLCHSRGWEWKQPSANRILDLVLQGPSQPIDDEDDEGMGDDEDETMQTEHEVVTAHINDSGYASASHLSSSPDVSFPAPMSYDSQRLKLRSELRIRHSAPASLPAFQPSQHLMPDYKLLYLSHTRIYSRILSSSYRVSILQTRATALPGPSYLGPHTSTIYCLALYTHPRTGVQTLFTGSKDHTVREWDLRTGTVLRVISGIHQSSVLSLSAADGYVVTGGSDRRVVVWELEPADGAECRLVGVIGDHTDSVLCVRFDHQRLVSCSKDRTVRTYKFPSLEREHVLDGHRAAVNAVSLAAESDLIVSGSGDRSIRLWDGKTGALVRVLENHHIRGIAAIDLRLPHVLSGSSDKHLRLFDVTQRAAHDHSWSTAEPVRTAMSAPAVCTFCGAIAPAAIEAAGDSRGHNDLVRSVALGEDFVVSGSYDLTIKVWNRNTGALVADLTGGHSGRIFCIAFDGTKVVSCGEDQRICIWDFAHGMDTSFIRL